MIIGITGGTGSGKSTVTAEFAKCGIPIIDGDVVSREVVATGKPAIYDIEKKFGSAYIAEDGSLRRRELGRLVFSNPDELARLNTLLMPYIKEEIQQKIHQYKEEIVVLDAPLLIEYGIDRICDVIIVVLAEEKKRKERLIIRDSLTEKEVWDRISSQNKDKFYLEKADYIVYNNSTMENLIKETHKIIDQLREKI